MAAKGRPILGDSLYDLPTSLVVGEGGKRKIDSGGSTTTGTSTAGSIGNGGSRLHLHAEKISFLHPVTQKRVTFVAPCPF